MQSGRLAQERAVLRVAGADHRAFLQDLISNDLDGVARGAVYAALLSPQGKYLFDFIAVADGDSILLDVAADRAAALAQRLAMYRLRAAVTVEPAQIAVAQVFGTAPDHPMSFADPRDPGLGWRVYAPDPAPLLSGMAAATRDDWDALRVRLMMPETGVELIADETYILEAGFERLHGVDFRKGCYVGQEVTARMKHKTELKKGLVRVRVEGAAAPGTEILAEGKPAGRLHTVAGGEGIAHLRHDRAGGEMWAGSARVTRTG